MGQSSWLHKPLSSEKQSKIWKQIPKERKFYIIFKFCWLYEWNLQYSILNIFKILRNFLSVLQLIWVQDFVILIFINAIFIFLWNDISLSLLPLGREFMCWFCAIACREVLVLRTGTCICTNIRLYEVTYLWKKFDCQCMKTI